MNFTQPRKEENLYALLVLGCAVLFTFYRWQYAPRIDAAAALANLSTTLRLDSAQHPKPAARATRSGATMPELLSRIQEIASANNVSIHNVRPSPVNPDEIAVGVEGEFRDLMRFMGRLETLQVSISSFDIAPKEHDGLVATIGLTRTSKPGAPEAFADYIDAIATYSAIRDPFKVGDPVPLPNTSSDLGDISWAYHLTSISLLDAERVATIDGKDYRVGDTFNGMAVTAIGPSGVTLTSPNSSIPQVLHFRHNPNSLDAR